MAALSPNRFMLVDVPPIHFYEGGPRCPEDICFPSALRACLEYLGDSPGCLHANGRGEGWNMNCAYAYLIGTSGVAFYLSWQPGWAGDNVAIHYMSSEPDAPYLRAFESVGYGVEFVSKEKGQGSESEFRKRIRENLCDQGRPVLGFGVIGPPEPSIITGWDEKGDVLIGWSFFQKMPEFSADAEPCGYFRKRNWYPDTQCLAVIGEKKEQAALSEIYCKSLQWGLEVARNPMPWPGRHNGLAAYSAWANDLLTREEDFSSNDLAWLAPIYSSHDDAVGFVAEARWYGSLFLKQIARDEPSMAESLEQAAACFRDEHDLMWKAWECVGGNGREEKQIRALKERGVREKIVSIILEARDKDAEALGLIEKALQSIKGRA